MKRGLVVVLLSLLLVNVGFVSAIEDGGIGPDSAFYFLDRLFDVFEDDISIKEERVAEIKDMIEKGDFESARRALELYREVAEELEEEIDPSREEEAKRSAEEIREVLEGLEDLIPEEEREDFVDDIIEREERIATSAEIAGKIKELCETLSEVDPVQYEATCKTDDDSPKWQRDLDDKLTEEQKNEAESFFRIMKGCFEGPENCQCDKISISSFAEVCSEVAPLAVKCEEGDESACELMDEKTEGIEDLLPDHLKAVLFKLEGDLEDSQHGLHVPKECEEAGALDRESCEKVMFRLHAPEECVEAFDRGEIEFESERKAHEECENVLFEVHAPPECIEAGLTDHDECGKLIFELEAPQECLDAGLTGEGRNDNRKCDEIMRKIGEQGGFGGPVSGDTFRCKDIDDPEKRLECFDSALNSFDDDFEDRFDEIRKEEEKCAIECDSRGKAWSFEDGECDCFDFDREFEIEDDFDDFKEGEKFEDHQEEFEEEMSDGVVGDEREEEREEDSSEEGPNDSENSGNGEEGEESGSEDGESGITGNIVAVDTSGNGFLDYFWR